MKEMVVRPLEATPELKDWLKEQCELHGWSYQEASRKAGLAENTISTIMNGRVPGERVITGLADVFHVKPEYISYLAGKRDDNPYEGKDELVMKLVDVFERLPEEDQDELLAMAHMKLERFRKSTE